MNRHFLLKLPIYLLILSSIYSFYKGFKNQTEWNGSKKRNLAGFIFSILGLLFYLCVDIFELE